MPGAERALFYLNFIAQLVLLYRLLHSKLYRTYFSLFLYWLVQAIPSVALMAIPFHSHRYAYVYWGAQTINLLMAVFVVQDLYRIALLEHPALASIARRSVVVALAIAAVVAVSLVVLVDLSYPFSGDFAIPPDDFQTGALAPFFHSAAGP